MIKINCQGCKNHCCGKIPNLIPVLMPEEEAEFADFSVSVKTPFRNMNVLAKKRNGNCIFLDEKTSKCKIYKKRPLECQLYPLLIDFNGLEPEFKIDKRYCQHINSLEFKECTFQKTGLKHIKL